MWSRNSTGLPLKYFVFAVCAVGLMGCGKFFPQQSEDLPNHFTLPPGTEIRVRLVSDVSSDTQPGTDFAGTLAGPLYYKRDLIDPQGNIFQREVQIAPEGAVVEGRVVADKESPGVEGPGPTPRTALQLTMVTLYGGEAFDIVTNPVLASLPVSRETKQFSQREKGDVLTFKLAEPVTMAMVIDLSDPVRNVKRRG